MGQKQRWGRRDISQLGLKVPQWKLRTRCTNQRTVSIQRYTEARIKIINSRLVAWRGLSRASTMPLILQTVEKLEPERVCALPKVSGLQLGAYFLV